MILWLSDHVCIGKENVSRTSGWLFRTNATNISMAFGWSYTRPRCHFRAEINIPMVMLLFNHGSNRIYTRQGVPSKIPQDLSASSNFACQNPL